MCRLQPIDKEKANFIEYLINQNQEIVTGFTPRVFP